MRREPWRAPRCIAVMSNGQPHHSSTLDTSEPFEVWWPKYLQRVSESIAAAEAHLQVPTGTVGAIATDPDHIAVVKACAVVEPILNDLIANWPKQFRGLGGLPIAPDYDEHFRSFITSLPIGGRSGKVGLAGGLGLLAPFQVEFAGALIRVRNRFAHNVKNMHRSLTEILTEEQTGQGRIVAQLTGMDVTLPLRPAFQGVDANILLKTFMYHRLADFLANALDTLRPPANLFEALLRGGKQKGAP
jgi:hypothetical protein